MANALILRTNLNEGIPGPEHFEMRQFPRPQLGDGLLVQLLVVSADPYMRYRIRSDGDFKANTPMLGLVAGKVLESNVPDWKPGDLFGAELPYVDIQAVPAAKLAMFRRLTGLVNEECLHQFHAHIPDICTCLCKCTDSIPWHTSSKCKLHELICVGETWKDNISLGIGALGMPGNLGWLFRICVTRLHGFRLHSVSIQVDGIRWSYRYLAP